MFLRSVATTGFLLGTVLYAPAALAVDITGNWQRGDGNARVSVTRCGAAFCARNTWIRDPSSGEKVGHVLVMNVKPTNNTMLAGTAYDPQRKLNLSATVSVSGDNMTTRGCVLGGVVCRSVSWTRIR